jgi:hypothetical protein
MLMIGVDVWNMNFRADHAVWLVARGHRTERYLYVVLHSQLRK